MTTKLHWLDFLAAHGATVHNGSVLDFGDAQSEKRAINDHTTLSILSDHGFIQASGEDAQSFLQNQFCNDVRLVTEEQSQINGYCSPKGRLLSLFRLFQRDGNYCLLLPQDGLAATLQRLNMFILMSKVSLHDVSDEFGALGLSGPNAETIIRAYFNGAPENADACQHAKQLTVIRVADAKPRFVICGSHENLIAAWSHLKSEAIPTGPAVWSLLDINAGLPEILQANRDQFVPQMVNLHSINGLSFKKGCYPGQEVVARMHYLGKQKRRMYLAHIETAASLLPGAPVFLESDRDGQAVGRIVTAEMSNTGGFDALAVMQIANVENQESIVTEAGERLFFKDFPYTVEVEGKKS